MEQLVGCRCARCENAIWSVLEGRFCSHCGAPVHHQCAQPSIVNACPECGSVVDHASTTPPVKTTPALVTAPRKQKNPTVAFTLSFFLPGAGLWYLGLGGCALLNFLGVLTVGFVAALALPEDVFERSIGSLNAACGGGSGGLAMALAMKRNTDADRKKKVTVFTV
jgi:hypothetical protein